VTIVVDQFIRSRDDFIGRAEILLHHENFRRLEIFIKVQEIIDIAPPETVNRLPVVTYAKKVPVAQEKLGEFVLEIVAVLVFVDQDI
jgi:hypothetical protein